MKVADLYAKLSLIVEKGTWQKGNDVISGLHKALVAFAGFEGIKAVAGMVGDVVELGGHLNDVSEKTGVSAETLQEWGYLAGLAGVSADEMNMAMGKLNKGLGEVALTGKGPVADAFHALGLSLQDPAIKSGNLDETLLNVANKFADMTDVAKKTKIATDLFGRSGANLIPTLNLGAAGVQKLKQEARDLGIVIDNKSITALDDMGDDMDRVKGAMRGVRNEAVVALLPVLHDMVTGLLEWLKANREVVRSAITGVVQGLAYAAKGLAYAFAFAAQAITFFQEHVELGETVLMALGVLIAAFALKAAIAWVIAFAPFILIVAAITAVIFVIRDLWQSITTGKGVSATIAKWIGDKFSAIADKIRSVVNSIGNFFRSIGSGIKSFFVGIIDWIGDKIDTLIDYMKRAANKIIQALNYLPGVNINELDTSVNSKGKSGGSSSSGPTASLGPSPTRTFAPSYAGVTVQQTVGDIRVDGASGDRVAIAKEVRRQVQEELSDQYRHAIGDVGGAEATA